MEWLSYALNIAFGVIASYVFIGVITKGKHIVYEPDKKMAVLELIMFIGIAGFGAVMLINYLIGGAGI